MCEGGGQQALGTLGDEMEASTRWVRPHRLLTDWPAADEGAALALALVEPIDSTSFVLMPSKVKWSCPCLTCLNREDPSRTGEKNGSDSEN